MNCDNSLPFPRGKTYSDGEGTPDSTYGAHLIGRVFETYDSQHSTAHKVKLRVVRLENAVTIPGTAAAPLHKLYAFGTDAKDLGRTLTGTLAGAGVICKPIDDAYAGAKVLAQYDLVYVIEEGPCKITTGATTVNLAQFDSVTSDSVGCVAAADAVVGQFVVGTIDAATDAEDTEVLVYVRGGLDKVPAAT